MAGDVVTMEKIVALAKRRGFVFPSSEIYGGVGSTYDYGHYGVLLKNNVKAEWWRAMLQERDDIVAIDSAILQHPRTWEASGHLEGFTDPLVDCRTCKQRFRADKLEDAPCGRKPSVHPGETPECDLTEARQFNLMFQTHVGPVLDDASVAYLRLRAHGPDELSHYSSATSDIEYLFPMGWSELEGIANRGDFDLRQHAEFSGEKLEYFDPQIKERYIPHVIEPAAGVDRAMLAF